ncbi:MAG: hypothetical protein ABWZ25_13310 [Chitinophagaceae bacterium]
MSSTDEHLNRIKTKLQLLLKQQGLLQKENQQLREEVLQLRAERVNTGQQLEELQQKTEILRYTQGEMDDTEKKQMEKRLTAYIREIDRCIAMLGQ